ncbi:MAG: LAGLIDADG family homing endonuclease [Patescibacteria group bacterium]
MLSSEKRTGAGNQQERQELTGWVIGFVDGEGCFTVSIFRNPTATRRVGYQVFCEFVVTQGERSRASLELLEKFFGCGYINRNRRHDNHREDVLKYCVRALNELNEIIIPFFEQHPLRTAKRNDFLVFKKIVRLVLKKKHLAIGGMDRIGKLIATMNRKRYPKVLESSETIRRTPVR